MTDTDDDGLNEEAFKGFGEDPTPITPPAKEPTEDGSTPTAEPPKGETTPAPAKEIKEDDEAAKKPETTPPVSTDEKKPEEDAKPTEITEASPAPEVPQPLTKDDVTAIISNLRNEERNSGKELETTTQEVLEKYYPDGLSNTLVDEKSGKELRTPADVVEASGDTMSTEEAAQWLMNEQYKLDQNVAKIKNDAKQIAETTVNFRRDAVAAVQKYEPLFKAYPVLQQKVFDKLKKQIKVDEAKGVILSAPDVMEHYDDYLEPYQQAYEFSTKQSATNPTAPAVPEPPKPTAEDRMDVTGDGGTTATDDPTDFAQQVNKELAKGI